MIKGKIKTLILISIALIITFFASGQKKTMIGKVTTLDSIPLIGVEIKVKSTNQSVFTDSIGNFKLQCNMEDKLKISADGFYNQSVDIPEKIRVVAVNLKPKPGNKNRTYDIGFGTVSEQDKTSAVSSLNEEDTNFTRYSDMYDLIQGNFSGVQIRNGEILVRGTGSFNSSSAALIIVDGVVSDSDVLRTLKPINIKSVNIIKDGSTAVYGSRGANGVVLIETKKGS